MSDILKRSIEAMREFCRRVEDGEVSSRYTYNKFKGILEDYDRSVTDSRD